MDTPKIIIVGSGFGGLCMAILLKRHKINSFVIYEKNDGVGGTWRENTYPGAACDVPSYLYSYSFEPKSDWRLKFGEQEQILEYIEYCATKYKIRDHIQFNTEVTAASFDEDANEWQVESKDKDGQNQSERAKFFISASGQLNRPFYPNIKGIETFEGVSFHSALWNHDYDLKGKTVAVIGNGASAVQFVPPVAAQVKQMYAYQRSPNWIIPKADREISDFEHWLYKKFPITAKLYRLRLYLSFEMKFVGLIKDNFLSEYGRKIISKYITGAVKDSELQKKLIPDYPTGCKRVLQTNEYYPALQQDNVEVIDDPLVEIKGKTLVNADGTEREVDAIIFGTGFTASDFLAPMEITGRQGLRLKDAWKDGPEAYKGIAVAGFPNMFLLYGPNTNLGHNSIIFMIENQVNYILKCIEKTMHKRINRIDVNPNRMKSYNQDIQQKLKRSVWESGCTSWYKLDSGKVVNNWPENTLRYQKAMRWDDMEGFDLN